MKTAIGQKQLRPPALAFVLAAGFGTRMRPLTDRTPKPLLPLWGQPILHRLLVALKGWGVAHALVNVHHAPGPLLAYLRSSPVPGLRITPLPEAEILGTGGALRAAAPYLSPDAEAPFWLVNGDIAMAGLAPDAFLRALAAAPGALKRSRKPPSTSFFSSFKWLSRISASPSRFFF